MNEASRARRLYEKRRQALARGAEDRAGLYLVLHRIYLARGMAEFHAEMGSTETALSLYRHAHDLYLTVRGRLKGRTG